MPSRPKSLLNPGFGGVRQGFAGGFAQHSPCCGPGTALGDVPGATVAANSLFTPLRHGGNAKLSVFWSYRSGFFTLSSPALPGGEAMSYELNTVVRHLMALAGADPGKVRLPEGKHKLRVHSQRIGDVRLVTVAPWQGTLPEVDAQGVAHLCAENDLLLLRGIVSAPPRTRTLWLALDGVGAVPLVPASPRIEKALRALVQHRVVIQGECAPHGIAVHTVHTVQAAPETFSTGHF